MHESSPSDTSSSPDNIPPLIPIQDLFPHLSQFKAMEQPSASTRLSRSRLRQATHNRCHRRRQVTPLLIPRSATTRQQTQAAANRVLAPEMLQSSRPEAPASPTPIPGSSPPPPYQPRAFITRPSSLQTRTETHNPIPQPSACPIAQNRAPTSSSTSSDEIPTVRKHKVPVPRPTAPPVPQRRTPISSKPSPEEILKARIEAVRKHKIIVARPSTPFVIPRRASMSSSASSDEPSAAQSVRKHKIPFSRPSTPFVAQTHAPMGTRPSPEEILDARMQTVRKLKAAVPQQSATSGPQRRQSMSSSVSSDETPAERKHNLAGSTSSPTSSDEASTAQAQPIRKRNLQGRQPSATPVSKRVTHMPSLTSCHESPAAQTKAVPKQGVPVSRPPASPAPQRNATMSRSASSGETAAAQMPSVRTSHVTSRGMQKPDLCAGGLDESSSDAQFPDRPPPVPTAGRCFQSLSTNSDVPSTEPTAVPPTRVLYNLTRGGENMQPSTSGQTYESSSTMFSQQGPSSCGSANTTAYHSSETGTNYPSGDTDQGSHESRFGPWVSHYARNQPNLVNLFRVMTPKSLLIDATSRLQHITDVLSNAASEGITINRKENRPRSEFNTSQQPSHSHVGAPPRFSFIPGMSSIYQRPVEGEISDILVPDGDDSILNSFSTSTDFQSRQSILAVKVAGNNVVQAAETLSVIGAFNNQLQNIENLVTQVVQEHQHFMPAPETIYGNAAECGTAKDTTNVYPGPSTMWQKPAQQQILPSFTTPSPTPFPSAPNLNIPMSPLQIQIPNVEFERSRSANPNPHPYGSSYSVVQHFSGSTPTPMTPPFATARQMYADITGPQAYRQGQESVEQLFTTSYTFNQTVVENIDVNMIPAYQPAIPTMNSMEGNPIPLSQPMLQHQTEGNTHDVNTENPSMPKPNCNCAICSIIRRCPSLTPNTAVASAIRMPNYSDNTMFYQPQPTNTSGNSAQFVPNTINFQSTNRSINPFLQTVQDHNFDATQDNSYPAPSYHTARQVDMHAPSANLRIPRTPTIPIDNAYIRAASSMATSSYRRETGITFEGDGRPVRPKRPTPEQQLPAPQNQNAEGEHSQAAPPQRPTGPRLPVFFCNRGHTIFPGESVATPDDVVRLRLIPVRPPYEFLSQGTSEGPASPNSPDSNMPLL